MVDYTPTRDGGRRLTLAGLLDKYMWRGARTPFLFFLAVAVMLLVLDQMLRLFEFVLEENGSIGLIWVMLGTLVPEYLALAAPIGFFLAALMAVRRLSLSSELDALASGGVSLSRLTQPVGFMGVGLMGATFLVVAYIQPYSAYEYSRLRFEVQSSAVSAQVRPGRFSEFGDGDFLRAARVNRATRALSDVFVERCPETETCLAIEAESGVIMRAGDGSDQLVLRLFNGRNIDLNVLPPDPMSFSFESWDQPIDLPTLEDFRARGGIKQEATFDELLRTTLAAPADRDDTYDAYRSALHWRVLHTLLFLALPFLAAALGVADKRRDKALGLVVGVALVILYYEALQAGEAQVADGKASPWLTMWPLWVVFMTLSVGVFRYVSARPGARAMAPLEWAIDRALDRVKAWARARALARLGARANPLEVLVRRIATLTRGGSKGFAAGPLSRLITWHLTWAFLGRFVALLAILVTVLSVLDFLDVTDDFARAERLIDNALWVYASLRVPELINQFAPFAALLAVLLTLAGMSYTSETIALRASGLSAWGLLLPFWIGCGVIALGHFVLQETIAAPSTAKLAYWRAADFEGDPDERLSRFGAVRLAQPGAVLSARSLERTERGFELKTARFYLRDEDGGITSVVRAPSAVHTREGWIAMDAVRIDLASGERVSVPSLGVAAPFAPERLVLETVEADEEPLSVIVRAIRARRADGGGVEELQTGFWRRFAAPAASLLMPLFGAVVGFGLHRSGALFARVVAGAALGFVFFVFDNSMAAMGNLGAVPGWFAAFAPIIVFGLGGVGALLAIER
ncbi:MAG: LptF/LptG family permease [Maricaulaceae bacterium]